MWKNVIGFGLHLSRFHYAASHQPFIWVAPQTAATCDNMATEADKERLRKAYETNSQRYGNHNTIEDVFERSIHPTPTELQDALAVTDCLTEKEATAFMHGILESYPKQMGGKTILPDGFVQKSEFDSVKEEARNKVADAIWIYELIDAYRFPDFPEECLDCGGKLGGRWVGYPSEGEPGVLCVDCANIDPELDN